MVQVRSRLWLPFTQMQSFDASERTFVAANGVMLEDSRGRRVFDATSSIWTIIHGHAHPALVRAISDQAARLDHVTTLGATNPATEALAARLCALAAMDYAFFSGDGASAVEAALKMALGYWQRAGQPQRTRFVHLQNSYHGDTAAAMSVSDIAAFRRRFGAVTVETLNIADAGDISGRDDVAAIIVEPQMQAAAGMQAYDDYDFLERIGDALVIADEIATGFGRTGTMFAYEQTPLEPDIVCVGKGLSGGILPLSATLVRERVFDAFLSGRQGEQFFHGHSFAGNPIACAAALASLELFAQEETLEHAARITHRIASNTEREIRGVRGVSRAGTMTGLTIDTDMIERGNYPSAGWRIAGGLYARGHFTRPIGDTIQLVPPLSTPLDHIDSFFDALETELRSCI